MNVNFPTFFGLPSLFDDPAFDFRLPPAVTLTKAVLISSLKALKAELPFKVSSPRISSTSDLYRIGLLPFLES